MVDGGGGGMSGHDQVWSAESAVRQLPLSLPLVSGLDKIKIVNKLTRSFVSTPVFAATEGSIAVLAFVFLFWRCRSLSRGGR